LLKAITVHRDIVLSVAWSVDGKTLASGSRNQTIKIWNVDVDN
jgi:WD40 repeat protein